MGKIFIKNRRTFYGPIFNIETSVLICLISITKNVGKRVVLGARTYLRRYSRRRISGRDAAQKGVSEPPTSPRGKGYEEDISPYQKHLK